MQTDDIAAWLTAIWDEREKACREAQDAIDTYTATAAQGTLELRWMLQLRKGGVFQGGWDMPGPPTPSEDLARIAADRQILTEHTRNAGRCDTCVTDVWVEYGDPVVGHHESYCPTVRYLAVPHASRPGYQEAWRP